MGALADEEKYGMVKKIIAVAGILCALCFTLLCINYVSNEKFIDRYNDRLYENSRITPVLGFTQPYIYHYNQGNIYFKNNDYDGAEYEYRRALGYNPSSRYDCSTRINLALSMVRPIDAESVTKENLDEVIEILESAKDVLIENGCAHRDDDDGHNKDAQTLKNEIDDFEDMLRQQVENQQNQQNQGNGGSSSDENDSQSESSTDEEQEQSGSDTLEDQLNDLQKDSLEQRQQEMDEYDYNSDDMDFSHSGSKPW